MSTPTRRQHRDRPSSPAKGPFCSVGIDDAKGGMGMDLLHMKRYVEPYHVLPPLGSLTQERTVSMEAAWLLPEFRDTIKAIRREAARLQNESDDARARLFCAAILDDTDKLPLEG